MSIRKITPDDVEYFTLETHPSREYSSGSTVSTSPGVTGTLYVFPRRSSSEKEVQPLSMFSASLFNDVNLDQLLVQARTFASASSSNTNQINGYLSGVYNQQPSVRKQQTVDVIRFTPPFSLNKNTMAKLLTVNDLMPYYRTTQPNAHFAVSNYNTLNFFTGSQVPSSSVIIYPNYMDPTIWPYGPYTPTGSWSVDFWINPRYTTDTKTNDFKAGTILQISGVLAVSLVTGSSRDINGFPDGYRMLVQLSSSAGTAPSLATTGALVFYSSDNSLRRNHWHHITIRHGGPTTPLYNNGTGSLLIDGNVDTQFILTTSLASSNLTSGYPNTDGPALLFLGNFYEGTNSGSSGTSRFFASDVADRDGLVELNSTTGIDYPASYSFNHPLNAEIHDIKIFNKYLSTQEISGYQQAGPSDLQNLLFYVPPFFSIEAPTQSFVGTYGGVLVTPFETKNDTTRDLFNVTMSFGVGGMYMNLENFGKEFVQGTFPRWLFLTGSTVNDTTQILDANQFLFATASNRKRQYTVLPCDNGQFYPNFQFLATGSKEKFKNDLGNLNYGYVSLRDMVPLRTFAFGLADSGSIVDGILGPSPTNLSGSISDSLAILHRTRDNTSNQVVFFDISNLYYGNKIKPGTFLLEDLAMSGSGGKVGISLRDDGLGNLYRANTLTSQSTWNSVGNIFYNEGIVMIKSPQLFFFGQEQWNMEFQGEQNIHVLKFNLLLPPLTATSSSNPSFMSASLNPLDTLANESDEQYVWLSGLYLHDDNLNVITKTNFAQPIVKRTGDKLMFAIKLDF